MELIKDNFTIFLLCFLLGVMVTLFFILMYGKEKMISEMEQIKYKSKRFLINMKDQSIVLVILFVVYIFFRVLGYEEEALPEIIGTGVSLFIINFFLEEKEYSKKKDLKELLNYKIEKIRDISNDMLLRYINFSEYDSNQISKELLVNILSNQDLMTETIEFISIKDTGEIYKEKVSKIDYPFFIAKELRPLLTQLIINYGQYLEHSQTIILIELEEVLNINIFKSRISFIPGIDDSAIEAYKLSFIEALDKFNCIVKKIEVRS